MIIYNIIFDFGGVLYDIDYLKCTANLAELSKKPELFQKLKIEEFINVSSDFEKGLVNSEQFRDLIREKYYISASDKIFDKAWNSMLIKINDESIKFLKKIKDKYRISLLSNSNQIHYNYFFNECKEMFECFDHLFFSFQIGMKKPDKEIFEFVCKKMNYIPEQTLFVDDNIHNIDCAKSANIKTFYFGSEALLSDLLHSIEIFTQK